MTPSTTDTNVADGKKSPSNDSVDEYEDAEKNYQPRSPKFWLIIIALYLALFLVALMDARAPAPHKARKGQPAVRHTAKVSLVGVARRNGSHRWPRLGHVMASRATEAPKI